MDFAHFKLKIKTIKRNIYTLKENNKMCFYDYICNNSFFYLMFVSL